MSKIDLKISSDFSMTPGPRYRSEGSFSGEEFREDFLFPRLKDAIAGQCKLIVNLDGTEGYGTSFLEESFGGLIRENGYSKSQIDDSIEYISNEEPYLINDIKEYITDAEKESK